MRGPTNIDGRTGFVSTFSNADRVEILPSVKIGEDKYAPAEDHTPSSVLTLDES